MPLRVPRDRRAAMVGGALGAIVAAWRWSRRRSASEAAARPDPADELRARLDASRAAAAGPAPPGEARASPARDADPETRRREVHEEARARLGGLKREETGERP